ncbi:MAG TPA: DUF1501 domain-containing protein [Pirellulales bacterium]|jgi:uncharacterized protein (DUF1501 family)|nr:DUF1501 domain-containing protein [Pirellulales bacterium]
MLEILGQQPVLSRRSLLAGGIRGLSGIALASLMASEGLLAADSSGRSDPLAPRKTHFAPTATNCIFFFMWGGPSQLDLFDPKPRLTELDGQPIPESLLANAQFAFVKKETARLKASPFKFQKHGQSGLEFSELLPQIGGCADDIALVRTLHSESFNHRPAQILLNTGFMRVGRPPLGSWLVYGLGSPSENLPGYVVLKTGPEPDGGSSNWSNAFLPSDYQGVLFRSEGPPILNVDNPAGLDAAAHRSSLDAVAELNRQHYEQVGDPEILTRIANYELAFRMQSAAPELTELSGESAATREAYGMNRVDAEEKSFARNCLLARRLVERGVRFVNIYFGNWDAHFNLVPNHTRLCKTVDQPIAALLKDLKQRGLLDTTLVVWAGEFGRTPVGENRSAGGEVSGRDHHPGSFSVWMAGGGVPGGRVIGATDEIGWNAVEDRMEINDLHATMLHLFGLDHKRLTYRYQGRDFRLTDVAGNVVEKLLRKPV